MPPLTAEQLVQAQSLKARAQTRYSTDAAIQASVKGIGAFLVASEAQLRELMENQPPVTTAGNIYAGSVLYWIHNDLPKDPLFHWIADLFPPTQIPTSTYQAWQTVWRTDGKVATDGTLYAYGTFSQLDPHWDFSFVLYLLNVLGEVPKADLFPTPLPKIDPIAWPDNPTLTIAIIGDWGTGPWDDCGTQGPAAEIMQQLQSLKPAPDLLVHLGDVYYSGTGNLPDKVVSFMKGLAAAMNKESGSDVQFMPNEETTRLIDAWWKTPPIPTSFTLNSNHEMYSGANGLLGVLGKPPFTAQKSASYFAINYADWVIVALDSGFFSSAFFNMEGALGDPQHQQQIEWVQKLNLAGKKVIALTHHTALTDDAQPIEGTQLCDDMHSALNGRDPDYWYWGHIHNGIVYSAAASMTPARSTGTLCRCVGHASIPFGPAYFWQGDKTYPLATHPDIEYVSSTSIYKPGDCPQWKNRVRNGFAVITLSPGGIQEDFYEQGQTTPVWSSKNPKA